MTAVAVCVVSAGASAQEAPDADAPPEKYPDPGQVRQAMHRATAFFRSNLSVAGGYAWSWPKDLSESRGENRAQPTLIMIQPPGTPAVGLAMLGAWRASDDPIHLQGAREAAQALAWCQLSSGGWPADYSFEPSNARRYHYRRDVLAGDLQPGKRRNRSSLDDNKSQSAIRFLMELATTPGADTAGDSARAALDFAWDGLLAAQAPNGGWPQQYSGPADPDLPVVRASFPEAWSRTFPDTDYPVYYTLNDNNLLNVMRLLLDAHHRETAGDERFLDAARRLGDFLLLAQLPEPQPGWAQQYNHAMHPDWARKFEPPAVSSVESLGAIRALHELWLETGEDRYLESVPAALDWLEGRQLADGRWARFYELETNRPLYCRAETYEVTHDDTDLPTHYGFKISSDLGEDIETIRSLLEESREGQLARRERQVPESEEDWSERARKLATKARTALDRQSSHGYWIKDDAIDAGEFVRHQQALADYLDAADQGGDTFRALRERELERERERQAEAAAKAGTANSAAPDHEN